MPQRQPRPCLRRFRQLLNSVPFLPAPLPRSCHVPRAGFFSQINRRPFSVRNSSVCWMCLEPLETSLACPTGRHHSCIFAKFLFFMRREHAIHHVHRTEYKPACMCVTVFVPITFPGSLISTRGSRAARANNASDEIPQSWRDDSAEIFALRRDSVKCDRRPKIHHNARPAVLMEPPPHHLQSCPLPLLKGCPPARPSRSSRPFPRTAPSSQNRFVPSSANVRFTGGTTELIATPLIAFQSSPARVRDFSSARRIRR